ncbi:MAG: DUF2167 domain-containing protein [bacterium]|nr:DUF2167 domain-containing protein [bacterium]
MRRNALRPFNHFIVMLSFIAAVTLFLPLCSVCAQDEPIDPSLPQISWLEGPSIGSLGEEAIIDVPVGYRFTEVEGTRQLLEYMQNVTDGTERGMLIHDSLGWFVVFEYIEAGFVKDDERDDLDADAMFKSLREGQEESNKERLKRGWDTLNLLNWVQEPYYNTTTNNLEWGTLIEAGDGGQSINYFTRFLGRRGYYSVTLVADPSQYTLVLPEFQAAMSGFNYTEGNRYAEFREGDKIAEYGLTALVVGGAGAVAAKAGIFKWLWKVIVVAIASAAGFLKKFFTGRSSESKAPGPPTA